MLAAWLGFSFMRMLPLQDAQVLPGDARTVKDGFVAAYLVPIGIHSVALVDCGKDPEGKAILGALAKEDLSPDAVKVIFLTHGHPDHLAACHLFPRAELMALEAEVPLIEGRAPPPGLLGKLFGIQHTGLHVTRALHDKDTVAVGNQRALVIAMPGHTLGSAAYLIGSALYLGDAADTNRSGEMIGPKPIFSADLAQSERSLVSLSRTLASSGLEVEAIAPAHSGPMPSTKALDVFAHDTGIE